MRALLFVAVRKSQLCLSGGAGRVGWPRFAADRLATKTCAKSGVGGARWWARGGAAVAAAAAAGAAPRTAAAAGQDAINMRRKKRCGLPATGRQKVSEKEN